MNKLSHTMTMLKAVFILILMISSRLINAQIPAGYYDAATGTGDELRMNLRTIITSGHTSNDYDDLYFYYESTDHFGSNKVWDMYSMDANGNAAYYYYFNGGDECGSYDEEGDCYNREHSVPQSWFGGSSPMYADLFIVVPTDGYVNNIRSNYPFGETTSPTWTSTNGSKRGSCSYPGYTGVIFEPIDAYKGDFARAYFYVVTRYNVSSWSGASFNGDGFSVWTKAMLLEWNDMDPVSTKEINRNNAVYDIQGNRNPYIDHPEWACEVFGSDCNTVDNPSDFIAVGVSVSEIDLSWMQNPDNDDILLAYNTSNAFGVPSGNYSVGNTISGGGTVLAAGDFNSYAHTGLSSQTFYYRIWSKNPTGEYSSGITIAASPLLGEPSNHVSAFMAYNPSSSTIDLQWSDATGGVLPGKYLIKANYFGNSITPPIDGVPENDGLFTKNIAYGTEFVKFTGLTQNTSYIFQIFPYTNSGNQINYKTDGTVPETSGTTVDIPDECGNETFDGITTGSSSYSTITWTGEDGSTWTATNTRTDQNLGNGPAVCVRNGYVQSGTIANGIGNLTVSTMRVFNGGTGVLNVYINSTQVGTVPYSDALQITTIQNIDVDGEIVLKMETLSTEDRIIIDDIVWTCYGISPNDDDSDVWPPGGQVPGGSLSSVADSQPEALDVFSFEIQDQGTTDGMVTDVTNIRIYPGPLNEVNWTDHIQGVLLNGGDIPVISTIMTDDYLDIQPTDLQIGDGESQTLTVSLWFNTSNIVDGQVLDFMIDADNHGFLADPAFSTFAPVINGGTDIISEVFVIDVEASIMSFDRDASDTEINIEMAPSPMLRLTDSNGNLDLDGSQMVSLSSTGTMTGDPISQQNVNGYVEYSDVIHTEEGFDLQLHASSGAMEANSAFFDVYCYPQPVTDFSVDCGSGEAEVSWTNPDCGDYAILVVHTASINGNPVGTYTVHSQDYSDPLNPDFPGGGKVVYSGTISPQTITGLTNMATYYFKMYVSHYGFWVSDTEIDCTPTGIAETDDYIRIWPNPANGILNIELTGESHQEMILYDITGKQMFDKSFAGKSVQFDISMLPEGIYIAEFRSGDRIFKQRILVAHR